MKDIISTDRNKIEAKDIFSTRASQVVPLKKAARI